MTTLKQAIEYLQNQWFDILFGDDNWVSITKEGEKVISAEMHDVNDDSEVVEFINAFLNGAI